MAIAGGLAAAAAPLPAGARPEPSDCVRVSQSSPYRNFGYDHLVHLHNTCPARVECTVATNVNPEPIETSVEAGAKKTVLTFRGSPARTFTSRVACAYP